MSGAMRVRISVKKTDTNESVAEKGSAGTNNSCCAQQIQIMTQLNAHNCFFPSRLHIRPVTPGL